VTTEHLKHLPLLCLRLTFSFGESLDAVGWVLKFLSRQQFGDGEDLQAGVRPGKSLDS
jgi:hypothetical protein